jgi:hypothetical protein
VRAPVRVRAQRTPALPIPETRSTAAPRSGAGPLNWGLRLRQFAAHRAPIISAPARNNVPAVYPLSVFAKDAEKSATIAKDRVKLALLAFLTDRKAAHGSRQGSQNPIVRQSEHASITSIRCASVPGTDRIRQPPLPAAGPGQVSIVKVSDHVAALLGRAGAEGKVVAMPARR